MLEIIQGKTTVAEASRQFDLIPSELEGWVEKAKAGMENALRAKPQDVRQQYEKQRVIVKSGVWCQRQFKFDPFRSEFGNLNLTPL